MLHSWGQRRSSEWIGFSPGTRTDANPPLIPFWSPIVKHATSPRAALVGRRYERAQDHKP